MGIASKIKILGSGKIIRTLLSIYNHGFTLLALLNSARRFKEASISDDYEKLSYESLYNQSLAMASHINHNYDIRSKSKVAFISANSVPFVKSLFAVSGLGADIFLLNPNQNREYVDVFLASQKIDLIVLDDAIAKEFNGIDTPIFCCKETINLVAKPTLKDIVKRKRGNLIILSSGSKGLPKMEKRTVSPIRFLNPLIEIIEKLNLKETKSVLISVPIFHGYGLAGLFLSIFLGKNIRLTKKFDTKKTFKILEEEKQDTWLAVPLMIQKIMDLGNPAFVKTIISGGDVLPSKTVDTIHKTTFAKLYNLYGTSETGICTIATNEDLQKYPNTIGKTITGIRAKITAADGSLLTAGNVGRLLVKCNWSSDNKDTIYTNTGDLVSKNNEEYFFYKGRLDDMMIIGGENIYPAEIETILYKNLSVKWTKARSIIDGKQRKIIHIDLVLNPGTSFCEKEFITWISNHAPGYMIPKSIALLDTEPIPKLM